MKKTITYLLIIASLVIILDSLNAGHALFMFFLAGVIPGTSIAINASNMLEIFALLFGFTLSRIANYLVGYIATRGTTLSTTHRSRASSAQA